MAARATVKLEMRAVARKKHHLTLAFVRAPFSSLNDTLLANASRLLPRPQIVIGQVHEKIANGRLVDEASLQLMCEGIDDLLRPATNKN